jgi:hypothetical protein
LSCCPSPESEWWARGTRRPTEAACPKRLATDLAARGLVNISFSPTFPGTLNAHPNESPERASASLFPDDAPSPHEQKLLKLLKPDESSQSGELVETLETEILRKRQFDSRFARSKLVAHSL